MMVYYSQNSIYDGIFKSFSLGHSQSWLFSYDVLNEHFKNMT